MTDNVVISEVRAVMYVVLSKPEKHVSYGKLVSTTKFITLQMRCRTNRVRYNRVQLYFESRSADFKPWTVKDFFI